MLGRQFFFLTNSHLFSAALCLSAGYGFVDFDSPAAAQKAVSSLKATGVQAQMAKVREHFGTNYPPSFRLHYRQLFAMHWIAHSGLI